MSRLRRRRKDGKFSLATILRFGIQAVRSIQAVHEVGFLHRDIKVWHTRDMCGGKGRDDGGTWCGCVAVRTRSHAPVAACCLGRQPSNFVIGSNRNTLHGSQTGATCPSDAGGALELSLMSPSKICIIDFGLARAFRDRATGAVLPSRGHIKGFRGTPRYASVHVHREEDLSRRDDLWSLFYILVEFCTGDLPWGSKRDKDEIGALKEKYMSLRLLKTGAPGDCPSCLVPFMQHLYSLSFESKPNYAYLIELLQHKLRKMGYGSCEGDGAADAQGDDAPFDWEDTSTLSTMDASIDATAAPAAAQAQTQPQALRSPGQPGFDVDALPSPMPVYSDADGGADVQAEASPGVGAQDLQQQRHALDVEYAPRTPTELELELDPDPQLLDQHVPQLPFGSGSFSFSVFGGGGGAGGGVGGALPSDSCSSLSAALAPQAAASASSSAAALQPCAALPGTSPFAPTDALPLASPVALLQPLPVAVAAAIAGAPFPASPGRAHAHSASVGSALALSPSSFAPGVPAGAPAPASASAFGSLPLAQPIPVPDTVILSPRRAHARSVSQHAAPAAAAAGPAMAAASPAPAAAASASAAVPAAVPAGAPAAALLPLRPTPPAGVPPPAYSVRSFGRFHRRLAERSPSKPLPLAQAQQIICDDHDGEVHVALRHIDASTAAMSLESAFAAVHEPTPAPAPPPPPAPS